MIHYPCARGGYVSVMNGQPEVDVGVNLDPWAQEPPAVALDATAGHARDSIDRALGPIETSASPPQPDASKPRWQFQNSPRGDDFDDPTESEFFTGEGLARALVRESVQNALDAAISSEQPVCIRFRLGTTSAAQVPSWLTDGLAPHLQASDGAENVVGSDCDWLLVEDFNCVGLSGDPEEDEPAADSQGKNNYFYFWRNVGRTDKTADERGSWGIGKAVFQTASRAKSFFGLTVRHVDGESLLRGKSVLKVHKVGDLRFRARGNFGQFESEHPEFALPIRDEERIAEFRSIFDSVREKKSGLSVLVPWLDKDVDEWTVDALGRYVCEQYFMPVVSGQLVVEVTDGVRKLSIEREDIHDVILNQLDGLLPANRVAMARMAEFAKWATERERDEYLVIRPPDSNRWSEVEIDGEELANVKARFEAGEPVAFRCGCKIREKGKAREAVWFSVFVQRDPELKRPIVSYVRRGITIPEVRSEVIGGVRALVTVEWPLLGRLLGDAENPAHTDWTPRKSRVEVKWDKPEPAIRFVRLSVHELVSRMLIADDEVDEELFKNIFSFFKADPKSEPRPSGKGKESGEPQIDVPPPVRVFSVDKTTDGFSIKSMPDLKRGDDVTVRVAYAIRRGNPFKQWDERDFDLAAMQVTTSGGESENVSGNTIRLAVKNPAEFAVQAKGFDPNRDLVVDVRRSVAS